MEKPEVVFLTDSEGFEALICNGQLVSKHEYVYATDWFKLLEDFFGIEVKQRFSDIDPDDRS